MTLLDRYLLNRIMWPLLATVMIALLDPRSMAVLPAFIVPQPSGLGSLSILVPNDRALANLSIHTQALIVQYPFLERLTNVNTDVLLR